MAAVAFAAVSKVFDGTVALDRLEFEVAEGAVHGLVGPNGSGKTTAIRCVCGLVRPSSGSLSVLGRDVSARRWEVRERIGYMPQASGLYEDLTPVENIEFFASGHGARPSRARAMELLELLGLRSRAGDPVHQLSGGMRHRVSLACALAHPSPLLLLDEPTAGIDPVLRHRLWVEFRRLRDAGATILVSTNQLDEAVHCDCVAILREGRLLLNEPPEAVLARGRTTVRMELPGGEIAERELREPESELPALVRETGAVRMAVHQPSLEEVLLELVEEEP